jgi:hypothetical protein
MAEREPWMSDDDGEQIQSAEVPCTDCGASACEPVNEHERARCRSCASRRDGEILALAREITFATRQPAHSEADDALGIDHGYDLAGAQSDRSDCLELDLIEGALVEVDLSPGEVADLIWAVVDYQHWPVDVLRKLSLGMISPE